MTGPELRQVVEENPVIAQMVDLAWEEAARTASEDKRRLLAQVVAAAMRRDADAPKVDELQIFLRTVMALDPVHVTLLVLVATPQSDPLRVDHGELLDRWPGGDALLDAALAALEREGLIARDEILSAAWFLGHYGRLFFRFLKHTGEADRLVQ